MLESRPVKILFLTHRAGTPSVRYRVEAFLPRFREAGHEVLAREYSSGILDLWPVLRAVSAADVVVLQKRLPPRWLTKAIRRRAKRLLYDFDDAVYLKRTAEGARPWGTRVRRFEAVVRAADAVTAGNSHLAEQARGAGAKSVTVLPTVLDPAKYEAVGRREHEGVIAGWIGAGGNLPYLEAILPLLRKSPVRIRVVCNRFPEGVEEIPWSEETEAEAVAAMDIGLAPMPDDEWTRGKCGTRVLQYHAAGVPVVADDVGAHRDLVGDGGYLVRSPEEWAEKVEFLARNPQVRAELGAKGRARLKERFTPAAVFGTWKPLVEGR